MLSWNQAYLAVAEAAGVARPDLVHVASDFIARCLPEERGGLLGDKSTSVVIDNTKIKRFVPDYVATTRYRDGMRRTMAWFDADPARRLVDEAVNRDHDRILEAYRVGEAAARRLFPRG